MLELAAGERDALGEPDQAGPRPGQRRDRGDGHRREAADLDLQVAAGETVTGETWVPEPPKGARFDRHVRFTGADGKVKVEAVTTWALLDRATGRLLRVRPELAAPFLDR